MVAVGNPCAEAVIVETAMRGAYAVVLNEADIAVLVDMAIELSGGVVSGVDACRGWMSACAGAGGARPTRQAQRRRRSY